MRTLITKSTFDFFSYDLDLHNTLTTKALVAIGDTTFKF